MELNFLTEEQIEAAHKADIELQEKDNKEHDYDYPNQMNRYIRKWQGRIRDAKPYWNLINNLSIERFNNLVELVSNEAEPYNYGRPKKEVELARIIRYNMTFKQRAVAYSIIKTRYEKFYKSTEVTNVH